MAGKKVISLPVQTRQKWICQEGDYSLRRQCRLAGISRNNVYYKPVVESAENLKLMRLIDKCYLKHPYYGSPRMTDWLCDQGYRVSRKRVVRLMRIMGLQAITPGPHTSKPACGHKVYPYLLKDLEITHPNQVWSTDITYIPMRHGYLYLTAVIDWYSRYVLSWELSNTIDSGFCVTALERAMSSDAEPEIFNTDQGSQFTSTEFTGVLKSRDIAISMDGKGRALDNVFIERLWWSVKYEDVYPKDYEDGESLFNGLDAYFRYYNQERKHSKLDKRTPAEVYFN